MIENELGYTIKSNLRRWTKTTVDCYYNGMMCNKCELAEDLKEQCRLKPIVLELVKKFGKPRRSDYGKEKEQTL